MRRHAHVDFQLFSQKSSGIPVADSTISPVSLCIHFLITPAVQTSTSGAGPSPQLSGSPEKSPKVVKVVSKGNRTPEKRTFPSSHSFMSTSEVSSSPRTTAGGARNIGTMTMEVLASSSQPPVVERERRSCMKLTVPCPRGMGFV